MRGRQLGSCVLLILIGFLTSCAIDTTQYPPEPQIVFQKSMAKVSKNISGVDTLFDIDLFFGLIDGDGDIGTQLADNPDTIILPPVNCFVQLYYRNDGIFFKDTLLKATDYTIPYLPNEGQDKTLMADVLIEIPYSLSAQLKFPYDTMYYSIQVEDRAKNLSNIIYTDTLVYSNF